MRNCILGLLVVGALASPMPAGAGPIVLNGGFETGDLTGWMCAGQDYCATDAVVVHSGSYSWVGFDNSGYATLSQSIATAAGAIYDFGFYSLARRSDAGNVLRYQIGSGPVVSVPLTTVWTLTSTNFTASGATTAINFYFETDPGTGTWLIDDVSVDAAGAVPDPGSTLLLFGISLTGLVAWRRRRS